MTLDEARDILADHLLGLHDDFDHPDGCEYPFCDDSFWLVTAAQDGIRG